MSSNFQHLHLANLGFVYDLLKITLPFNKNVSIIQLIIDNQRNGLETKWACLTKANHIYVRNYFCQGGEKTDVMMLVYRKNEIYIRTHLGIYSLLFKPLKSNTF